MPTLPNSDRHVAHHGALEVAPRRRNHGELYHAVLGPEQDVICARGQHVVDLGDDVSGLNRAVDDCARAVCDTCHLERGAHARERVPATIVVACTFSFQ